MRRIVLLILGAAVGGFAAGGARALFARPAPAEAPKAPVLAAVPVVPRESGKDSLPGARADGVESGRDRVWVTGVAVRETRVGKQLRKRINVMLSDGRVLSEMDSELETVTRTFAVVGGEKLYFRVSREGGLQAQALGDVLAAKAEAGKVDAVSSAGAAAPVTGVFGSWRLDADGVQRLVNPDRLPSR